MSHKGGQFGWLGAFASLTMMLCVQWLHSPLSHAVGCSGDACAHTPQPPVAACGHHHAVPPAEEEEPVPAEAPGHSQECPVCQFLQQPLEPMAAPVQVAGIESATIASESAASRLCGCPLSRPHVRGPPGCPA